MLFVRAGGVDPGGVVQPFIGWVGNEGVVNWDGSLVSFPVTELSQRGELPSPCTASFQALSVNAFR